MTKNSVLELLEQSTADLSGEELSARLGVSRAAIWKAVRQLRKEGFKISAGTNRGYRLVGMPDRLDREKIAALAGIDAEKVALYDAVDSTNDLAKTLAQKGAPGGTAVLADTQKNGRGRRGRSFFSPPGTGIYMSVILRPAALPERIMNLTALSAVAASDAIEEVCGIRPEIKWTNDLVFGKKKVAGILTELSLVAETREVEFVVLGIGINVSQKEFPEPLREIAASIFTVSGKTVERNVLCAALVRKFAEMEKKLPGERPEEMEKYRKHCVNVGKTVKIIRGDTEKEAFCKDVCKDGALLVQYKDGTEEKIASGEVTVRGMYGYV